MTLAEADLVADVLEASVRAGGSESLAGIVIDALNRAGSKYLYCILRPFDTCHRSRHFSGTQIWASPRSGRYVPRTDAELLNSWRRQHVMTVDEADTLCLVLNQGCACSSDALLAVASLLPRAYPDFTWSVVRRPEGPGLPLTLAVHPADDLKHYGHGDLMPEEVMTGVRDQLSREEQGS